MEERPGFEGGRNIAIKVPEYRFAETVAFYRDVLGLPALGPSDGSERFAFGAMTLWVDRVPHQSQVDVWLEVRAEDPHRAAEWLARRGVPVRDALEPLGEVGGHWVSDPAGVVLLVAPSDEA